MALLQTAKDVLRAIVTKIRCSIRFAGCAVSASTI